MYVHICIFMYMYIACTYMFMLVHNFVNMYIHAFTMYRDICTNLPFLVQVVRIPDVFSLSQVGFDNMPGPAWVDYRLNVSFPLLRLRLLCSALVPPHVHFKLWIPSLSWLVNHDQTTQHWAPPRMGLASRIGRTGIETHWMAARNPLPVDSPCFSGCARRPASFARYNENSRSSAFQFSTF